MKETDEQHDPLHEQMIRNRRRIAPGHWSNRDIDCLLRVIDGARAVAATCTEGAIKKLVAELAKRADNQSERAVFEEATEILLYQACVRAKTLIGFDCRDRIEWGENYNQAFKDVFDRLVVALAAYDATALADALRPFAKAADRIPSVMTDNDSGINVRVGDLRAAAKALAAHDATQDGRGERWAVKTIPADMIVTPMPSRTSQCSSCSVATRTHMPPSANGPMIASR